MSKSNKQITLNKNKERYVGLDIVRIIAVLFVISIHFFLNNGFYSHSITNNTMYIMSLMRTLFFSCVPLFLIISGYLLSQKQLCKEYYKGLGKILFIYIFSSLACVLYNVFIIKKVTNFYDIIKSILAIANPNQEWFVGAPYGWYIGLYIGLFLLIPFINLTYNGLKSRNQKKVLLATMIFLTLLPSLFNGYAKFFDNSLKLLPDFWVMIYPLTFYFIGAYIKEFKININKLLLLGLLLLTVIIETISTVYYSQNFVAAKTYTPPFIGGYSGYGDFFAMIIAVCVFLILYNIKCSANPVKKALAFVANLTLGIYLCSWIGDRIIYPYFLSRILVFEDFLSYYLIIVPLVFLISAVISLIIELLYKLYKLLIKFLKQQNSTR